MKYYPEIDNDSLRNLPAREFVNESQAIDHFKNRYGTSLMAIVCDHPEEGPILVYEREDLR